MAEKPSRRIRGLIAGSRAKLEQVTRAWRLRVTSSEESISMEALCDLLLDELEEVQTALDEIRGKHDVT